MRPFSKKKKEKKKCVWDKKTTHTWGTSQMTY